MSASAGGSSAATMSAIETFSNNQEMVETLQTTVRSVKKGEWVSQVRVRTVMIWLAGCLVHCNAQRPGAITGATLAEYQAAGVSQVGRGKYTTMVVKKPQDRHHRECKDYTWWKPGLSPEAVRRAPQAGARGKQHESTTLPEQGGAPTGSPVETRTQAGR